MSAPAKPPSPPPPPPPPPTHRRLVLTDHVAFRYLEEDPAATVLARRQQLEGYELYLVEQWACSRTHPTFVITTFSGDPADTVWGGVLSVPAAEEAWSPHLRAYFRALDRYRARRIETAYGALMVTNLSVFPSSLTLIPVPDGDAKKSRELFFVNVNLKRLGCSGRLGITLAPPNSATQAKFHQLYRTFDKNPLNAAVLELVQLCQLALVLFGLLVPAYADGLLCDPTEKAIGDWWVEFGAEYYAVEPHDGILGPTTVAALLGLLMGARNRLAASNAPVAKDVFDMDATKRAISHFQKTQRIQRTGLLDRQTLDRLRRATAKAASKEGWNVPRALKSTVAELGGKGGEMVMGMVGAGDKAGIADVETVDIDRFVELVHGERAKWLWRGKPRKTNTVAMFSRLPGEDGSAPDEPRSATGKQLRKDLTEDLHKLVKRDTHPDEAKKPHDIPGIAESFDKEKDPFSKRAAIKRATEKIESGSGFHRIKDVVGRLNHQSKNSKEDIQNGLVPLTHTQSEVGRPSIESNSPPPTLRTHTDTGPLFTKTITETPQDPTAALHVALDSTTHSDAGDLQGSAPFHQRAGTGESGFYTPPTVKSSIAGSVYRDIDTMEKLPFEPTDTVPLPLRRTQSSEDLTLYHASRRNPNWWPRHLSFSIAEESVLTWPTLASLSSYSSSSSSSGALLDNEEDDTRQYLAAKLAALRHKSTLTQTLYSHLSSISLTDAKWTASSVQRVTDFDVQVESDVAELQQMYYSRLEEYQSLRDDAHEIVARDKEQLNEALRDLETLGAKLDYEIGSLKGKVDDVEDGVVELERQVVFVEDRVAELERVVGSREWEGWVHWGLRVVLGLGRKPEG